jgi:hypothetical protein
MWTFPNSNWTGLNWLSAAFVTTLDMAQSGANELISPATASAIN